MRIVATLLVLCSVAGMLAAQEPVITPDMPVTTATLHQWLHSGDPRLITWAADFSRRTHNAEIIAEMPEWLQHWPMPPLYGDRDWQDTQQRIPARLPILAVLDTLIQDNAQVPIPAINSVALSFPDQASILMARHPLSESRPDLEEWALGINGNVSQRYLARIALMILAKDPRQSTTGFWHKDSSDDFRPLGLVGFVVASSEARLQITVNSNGSSKPETGGGACGDSAGRKPSPGWPAVYDYVVLDYNKDPDKPVLVELGDDRITTWREETNGVAPGSCHGIGWLDPEYVSHELIAYWLGVKPWDVAWHPQQNFAIKWVNKADYERKLGKIVETERQKLRATVQALHKRGLLTDDQATDVLPKLVVDIQCDLQPCPLE